MDFGTLVHHSVLNLPNAIDVFADNVVLQNLSSQKSVYYVGQTTEFNQNTDTNLTATLSIFQVQ